MLGEIPYLLDNFINFIFMEIVEFNSLFMIFFLLWFLFFLCEWLDGLLNGLILFDLISKLFWFDSLWDLFLNRLIWLFLELRLKFLVDLIIFRNFFLDFIIELFLGFWLFLYFLFDFLIIENVGGSQRLSEIFQSLAIQCI